MSIHRRNPFNPMPGPVIPGRHPGHNIGGSPGTLKGRVAGQRCMPGSMRNGGCQPGLVCSAGGDMGVPVCRDPTRPLGPGGKPPHHSTPTHYRGLGSKCNFMAGAGNQMGCMQGECLDKDGRVVGPGQSGNCMIPARQPNLGPGGKPPHHSTPTHYRGLGSKCNFMAGAGNQMGCMQGECLDKDGRVVGPGKSGNCMIPAHHSIPTHLVGDCIVGGQNPHCGKGSYCKPLSSRTPKGGPHRIGGRGMCTPLPHPHPRPHPHPHQKPVPLGGKCNPSERTICAPPGQCVGAGRPGASGTCMISAHPQHKPHHKPIPAHLAFPEWDIGVGEADFGNISIANVGDIYLPVQNYMGQEYPGPQAPHMYRPGQDKNYHYK